MWYCVRPDGADAQDDKDIDEALAKLCKGSKLGVAPRVMTSAAEAAFVSNEHTRGRMSAFTCSWSSICRNRAFSGINIARAHQRAPSESARSVVRTVITRGSRFDSREVWSTSCCRQRGPC